MAQIIILMGVSGCGKTTVGEALAEKLAVPFYDADDYHPPQNVAKMSRGMPLNDDDRYPWLARLHELMTEHLEAGKRRFSAARRSSKNTAINCVENTKTCILSTSRAVLS